MAETLDKVALSVAMDMLVEREELIEALAAFVELHVTLDAWGLPWVYSLSQHENPPVNFIELTKSQAELLQVITNP